MKRVTSGRIGAAALAIVAGLVLTGAWAPLDPAVLDTLTGMGGVTFGLLWGCGVCVGGGMLLAASGVSGILAFLAGATNLARIGGCVATCAAALTT